MIYFNKKNIIIVLTMILATIWGSFAKYKDGLAEEDNLPSCSYDIFSADVINEMEHMTNDDILEVYIWLNDSGVDEIIQKVEENTGLKEEIILSDSEKIYKKIPESLRYEDYEAYEIFYNENKKEIEKISRQADTYIENERRFAKEWYNNYNYEFISEYLKEANIIFQSQYAPMLICEMSKEQLLSLRGNEKIEIINKYYNMFGEDCFSIYDSVNSLGGLYNRYVLSANGTGVKVGQFECEVPDLTISDLSGISITRKSSTPVDPHAGKVASIMVGNNGFAPGAHLYCTPSINSSYYYEQIEWLIGNNVNVINFSWVAGYDSLNPYGTYNDLDKWIDHISNQHSVTVVCATGNHKYKDGNLVEASTYVRSPGMAYNAITVGGVDNNNTSSRADDYYYAGTSYKEQSNMAFKPDVIAPATNFTYTGGSPSNGTSFAAPHVTGTIAQMMTYCPSLKLRPDAIKAAVMASANRKITGETIYAITNKEGSGEMYTYNALPILADILSKGTYYFDSLSVRNYSYTPTSSGNKKVVLCWQKKIQCSGINHGTITDYSLTNFDLTIYDSNGNIVASSGFLKNHAEMVVFNATKGQTYTIKIKKMTSASTEHYSLAIGNV